ncbi:MAG TPA: endonuclease/exonuclease/phosphatase family protein [Gaiellaceae bacterium]|nr:endonuclease/exonuclease/phosphatase family protein [Gaiellaceae bacterium]
MTAKTLPGMPPPAAADRLRVATLNIWGRFADWPRRRAILAKQLPPLAIDVYLLQEVVCGDGRGDQLAEVAELLGYEWSTRVIAENRPQETEDEGVAILSRLPLHSTAVWPLPPSHPPRHRLEASVEWSGTTLRLMTLHAAVSKGDGRDEQIACLAELKAEPLLLGSDLNAPPSLVRPLLDNSFADTLSWDEQPTWPLNADEFVQAWQEKLGEKPQGESKPRRLDYLLYRGIDALDSGTIAVREPERSASDHRLVWADLRPQSASNR